MIRRGPTADQLMLHCMASPSCTPEPEEAGGLMGVAQLQILAITGVPSC